MEAVDVAICEAEDPVSFGFNPIAVWLRGQYGIYWGRRRDGAEGYVLLVASASARAAVSSFPGWVRFLGGIFGIALL